MAGTIFAGTYTSTILLDNPIQQSPATLTGTISVAGTSAASDSGFYGVAGDQFSIDNLGQIRASGVSSYGILLLGGGVITNGAGGSNLGLIQSDETGILLTGTQTSTVFNDGTIIGTAGRGVFLQDGGRVSNGGTNATTATILGGFEGVAIYNPYGLLTNAGTIRDTGSAGFGAELYSGTVVNGVSATMSGVYGLGFVAHNGAASTLTNRGTLTGTGRDGVVFTAGGTVINSCTISGAIAGVLALYGTVDITNGRALSGGYAGADLLSGGTVLNQGGGQISGEFGISIGNGNSAGALGYVTNYGSIVASTYQGVSLNEGGTVDNFGTIVGASAAIAAFYGSATVTNAGQLSGGTGGFGIYLGAGGTVANNQGGTISGTIGVALQDGGFGETLSGLVTLSNAGVIDGTGNEALRVLAGGVITNEAGGVISGGKYGVYVQAVAGTFANYGTISGGIGFYQRRVVTSGGTVTPDVTLINAGTIIGDNGVAVSLYHSNDLLVDRPGAVFQGSVIGGGGRLELAAGGTGTLGTLGDALAGFGAVTLDSGAVWTGGGTIASTALMTNAGTWELTHQTLVLAGTLGGTGTVMLGPGGELMTTGTVLAGGTIGFGLAGGTLGLGAPMAENGLITGFAAGDTLWLPNVLDSGVSESFANGTLTLTQHGSTIARLALQGAYTSNSFALAPDAAGGTDVVIPCFVAGTLLAMRDGAMAVQDIRPGMRALTASGGMRRVIWVGHRTLTLNGGSAGAPILIRAHAFAPNQPARDLALSPDHAVFHAGVLIPAHLLVNGRSIVRARCRSVAYWHVELERHDIMLAENLPVESYLDTGNRHQFEARGREAGGREAGGRVVRRPPAPPCAPLVLGGAALTRARRHVLVQAAARESRPNWMAAELEGRRMAAARINDRQAVFLLPPEAERVTLLPSRPCSFSALLDGRRWQPRTTAGQPVTLPLPHTNQRRSLELCRL